MQEKRVCELQNRNNYKKRTSIWLTKSILRDAKLIPNKKHHWSWLNELNI
jgi:hypothetical protein